jgi:hypothetical protein
MSHVLSVALSPSRAKAKFRNPCGASPHLIPKKLTAMNVPDKHASKLTQNQHLTKTPQLSKWRHKQPQTKKSLLRIRHRQIGTNRICAQKRQARTHRSRLKQSVWTGKSSE